MRCLSETSALTLFAPAKLNLFLQVLGKRPDGYHELDTLMVSVGIYDSLRFTEEPSGGIELRCRDAGSIFRRDADRGQTLPTGEDNLVVRAARLLQESTGTRRGARIELCKRIPLAAGLGGGSSDAAATLVGLNRFWKLGLSSPELHALAARLGSDVNFFLSPTPLARCRGRGEQIEPLRLPLALHFVIARPRTGIATAQVFKHCRPEATAPSANDLVEKLSRGELGNAGKLLHNSLQAPAEQLNDEVLQLKRTFDRLPFLGHQLTGSGTSYFGLCANRDHASRLAARVRAESPADYFVAAATCSP